MPEPYYKSDGIELHLGDCLDVLKTMPDASVDAVCTDPPYALPGGFMGKSWDRFEGRENAPFAYWFSGLVDGEGCFTIKRHPRGTFSTTFALKMRRDERGTLEYIQRTLGFGTIRDLPASGGSKPQAVFLVQDKAGCQRLVDLFDKYPLRAKKRLDFDVWRTAVCEWTDRPRGNRWRGAADPTRMAALKGRLEGVRLYADPPWSGNEFQDWCRLWAAECLRVLKPGGHLLAFGGPRTYHRLVCAIEDAGFEIRDSIHWIFGSGFPKGQDMGKAIDRRREDRSKVLQVTAWLASARDAAGWTNAQIDGLFGFSGMGGLWTTQGKAAIVPQLAQWDRIREVVGFDDTEIRPLVVELNARKGRLGESWEEREIIGRRSVPNRKSDHLYGDFSGDDRLTLPSSVAAQRWEGWNTSLKPAHEPIVLARKSTGFNTTVANVLEHGTGALNIAACRVEPTGESRPRVAEASQETRYTERGGTNFAPLPGVRGGAPEGRWPTNLVFSHSAGCVEDGPCQTDCPVAELDRQSGVTTSSGGVKGGQIGVNATFGQYEHNGPRANAGGLGDRGGASRFFPVFRYEAKAPNSERPKLKDGTAHPTVKPVSLMSWLVRLVTPPGGVVLDPFAGSGTTGEACVIEGFRSVLIELDPKHAELIKARLSKPLQPALDLFSEVPDGA